MSSSFDERALIAVLQRCRQLVSSSEDADWSSMDVADILGILDPAIRRLETSLPVRIDELRLLFAPTGSLQETSISNGWTEEYLSLAARFDEFIGEPS